MPFEDNLKRGQITEGRIAKWLMKVRHNLIFPAYQIEQDHGKGPQLFSLEKQWVVPDMLAYTYKGIVWIEAKHKTVFSWYRIDRKWVTGIDLRHYFDYHEVNKQTRLPVYVLFFHESSNPSDNDKKYGCPEECPTGLFYGELNYLLRSESHRVPRHDPERTGMVGHGNSGMVYWAYDALRFLATKQEVIEASK